MRDLDRNPTTAARPPGSRAWRLALLGAVLAAAAVTLPFAGPTLKLKDGRVISGVDMRREGDLIILIMPNKTGIPVPAAAVAELVWVEGSGAPSRPANVVRGRTDEEAAEAMARREQRDAENDAWAQQRHAEMEEDRRYEEQQKQEEWYRDNWGYIQPSGFVGFQPTVAGSTLQPSYWVPDPTQDIGYHP